MLSQFFRQLLRLYVCVPLEHFQGLVSCHARHVHDAQALLEQARRGFVAQVMEAQICQEGRIRPFRSRSHSAVRPEQCVRQAACQSRSMLRAATRSCAAKPTDLNTVRLCTEGEASAHKSKASRRSADAVSPCSAR